MDIALITELIGSFGFPIALVIALCWFIMKIYNQSVSREEKLMEEIAENRAVNDKAIETLAVYAERLGVIENDVKEIKNIILTTDTNN